MLISTLVSHWLVSAPISSDFGDSGVLGMRGFSFAQYPDDLSDIAYILLSFPTLSLTNKTGLLSTNSIAWGRIFILL